MNTAGISDAGVFEQPSVRREKDSVDDFEHLGLDSSPTQGDVDLATSSVSSATRDVLGEIDKTAGNVADKIVDELQNQPPKVLGSTLGPNMDSNLFEMGDTLLDKEMDADDKMDKFISQLTSFAPPVPSHEVSPIIEDRKPRYDGYDGIKNFLDMEREKAFINEAPAKPVQQHIEELNFSEPAVGDLLSSNIDLHEKEQEILPPELLEIEKEESSVLDDPISEIVAPQAAKLEPLFAEKPLPKEAETIIEQQQKVKPFQPPEVAPQVSSAAPDISNSQANLPVNEPISVEKLNIHVKKADVDADEEAFPKEFEKSQPMPAEEAQKTVESFQQYETTFQLEPNLTDLEEVFKNMGLDAWFHPERLNPRVEGLIYWRDPMRSGPVFGGVLVILLALTYLSFISVVAYLSLLTLTATISFRIYKNVLQAVQKTGDGHPFKEFLDMNITLPQEKVSEIIEVAVAHFNASTSELRRLFLVDDLVDSIKFGVTLWCLTYLGAWFNGMTLVIIAWVALFTLPKVYETNKTQIDTNLDHVRSKIAEITSKVKAAIPIGKKVEEKKEQ